uniref:Uncharacterized protein n=1 Tax=Rhizophora mucronata TaxID=61149 RepID=A0A2P2NEZ1_RHIMU
MRSSIKKKKNPRKYLHQFAIKHKTLHDKADMC